MRSSRSRRCRGMMVMSWDSQRKATSEGVKGPVPERGAGVAIGGGVYVGVCRYMWVYVGLCGGVDVAVDVLYWWVGGVSGVMIVGREARHGSKSRVG